MDKVIKEFDVLMFGEPAGVMRVYETGIWKLEYLPEYRNDRSKPPFSASLKKAAASIEHQGIFPFFDGILPEGWLAELGENFGIPMESKVDAVSHYLKDAIGGVSIIGNHGKGPSRPLKK